MSISTPRPWLKSYADNVPEEIELLGGSLYDLVAASVTEFASAVALEFFGATTTYAEMGQQIDRAAEGLRLLGVQKGDTVALVLPNCPQHIVAFYAVLRLGAIVVEHNPLYTPRELRHQFEDHGARVVIAWDKTVATIQDFPEDVAVETIISVDLTRAMPFTARALLRLPIAKARESRAALTTKVRGTIEWKKLLDSPPIDERIFRPDAADVALIQYTSGTTGSPKGATLTHLNLTTNAAQARTWVRFAHVHGAERKAAQRLIADLHYSANPGGSGFTHAIHIDRLVHAWVSAYLSLCSRFSSKSINGSISGMSML